MASLLQIVDTDLTTVLLDLNGANTEHGAVTWALLSDPDFTGPTYANDRFEFANADGGTTAKHSARLSTMTFRVRPSASSYDALAAGLNRLGTLLAAGGTLKWIPHGSANTRFRDFEPSDTPVLFDGRELGIYNATVLFQKFDGVTIQLTVQPFWYGPELDSVSNLLTNATLLLDRTTGDEAPDTWAIDNAASVTDNGAVADEEAFSLTITTAVTRNLQQTTPAASVGNSETWTLAFEAKVASGANGRALALVQPLTAASANNGSAFTGTEATLTTAWQTISVTGTTPAANTDKARIDLRLRSASGSVQFYVRNARFVEAASVPPMFVGNETVNNDPATNRGRVVMFYNPGSASTPVQVRHLDYGSTNADRLHIAVRNGWRANLTDYANARYFLQAEAMTLGTDTTLSAGGGTYSGSGSNIATTTFATNDLDTDRLSASLSTFLDGLRGHTWAVFARVNGTVGSDDFTIRFTHSFEVPSGTILFNGISEDTSVDDIGTGVKEWRIGTMAVPANAGRVNLNLFVRRDVGSGNFIWDVLVFVPLDHYGKVTSSDVLTSRYVLTDPANNGVAMVSAAEEPWVTMTSDGPIPFTASPGLSAIYIHGAGRDPANPDADDSSGFGASTLGFRFKPRYHA